MCRKIPTLLIVGLAVVACARTAQADFYSVDGYSETFTFVNVTANNVVDAAAGESQLSVDLTGYAATSGADTPTSIGFKFLNDVGEPMSITDVYFYDGVLLELGAPSVRDSDGTGTGVYFHDPASPAHLPGYDVDGVVFSTDSGDPKIDVASSGVNTAAEWVEVIYGIRSTADWNSVIDAIETGDIVLGIHVQAFAGGGSESFITTPLPGAVLLGFLGLGYAGMKLRKHA